MKHSPTRVLIIEEEETARNATAAILASAPDIEVVGIAANAADGLRLFERRLPDVVCINTNLPDNGAMGLTREIMATRPRPILVLSTTAASEEVFRLLEAGAVDVLPRPGGPSDSSPETARALIRRVKVLAGVSVFRRPIRRGGPEDHPAPHARAIDARAASQMVAIGASTGGPQALRTILTDLPADFPAPILVVQHISEGFLDGLIDWLQPKCHLELLAGAPGMLPRPGHVYFAPDQCHLTLDGRRRLACPPGRPVDGHCPSVTMTFRSLAEHYASGAIGVLLTGMGSDGVDGLSAIRDAGGTTIAQDEATSLVFGMPARAIAAGAAAHVLPLPAIAKALQQAVARPRPGRGG